MTSSTFRFRTLVNAGLLVAFGAASVGCMSVKYDRLEYADLNKIDGKNFGVPFYEGRPFLLIVNGCDDRGNPSRSVSIITLPDLSRPYRARISGQIGKAELTVSLSNSVLVSTTASTQESFSDALTAITGLATAYGQVTSGAIDRDAEDKEDNGDSNRCDIGAIELYEFVYESDSGSFKGLKKRDVF